MSEEPLTPAEQDAAQPDEATAAPFAAGVGDEEPEEGSAEEAPSSEDDPQSPESRGPGPGEDKSDDQLIRETAALLFASPEPLSEGRLRALLERPRPARVRAAVEALGQRIEQVGLPLQVRQLRGGWTLLTTPECGDVVARLSGQAGPERISGAALETLAIVAYRQPVTKAEVEAVRGVQAGPILRTLVDRGLVKITGRAEVPGAPLEYGTTKDFLDRFGLGSLEELPRDAELTRD
ncbi:MAG: SMC-Scp complex subunit ScpB [Planctomycetes bacterium]|nr:SMC-Scp complex subunit ScpB [Planctomycetota bacterium]MDA0948281.1 SMC-Scp complex subunit ScpB [Planctomycetota bacterium]